MITPTLYSDRLILRPFQAKDLVPAYQIWFSQPDVAKYMFWKRHDSLQETQAWLSEELSSVKDADWYRFAVENHVTHQLLGTILLYYEEELSEWEIAYCFGRCYWNQGFATESLNRVITFAKESLHLEKIVARYATENTASGRVLEKLGFCFEKSIAYYCNGGTTLLPGALCSLTLR